MTIDEAIDFLRMHQPMSLSACQDALVLRELNSVRLYFIDHPDIRAIPLLLNVFGEGDGLGVYQLIDDAIKVYPPSIVIPHIQRALASAHSSVRTWNAEIACCFLDMALEPLLQDMLLATSEDERDAASECLARLRAI